MHHGASHRFRVFPFGPRMALVVVPRERRGVSHRFRVFPFGPRTAPISAVVVPGERRGASHRFHVLPFGPRLASISAVVIPGGTAVRLIDFVFCRSVHVWLLAPRCVS